MPRTLANVGVRGSSTNATKWRVIGMGILLDDGTTVTTAALTAYQRAATAEGEG